MNYFNQILLNKGFINNYVEASDLKITKEEMQELKEMSDNEYDEICEAVAMGKIPDGMAGFMETINNRMDILKINKYVCIDIDKISPFDRSAKMEDENKKRYNIIKKYKKYIFDDLCLKVHFNIINMCKNIEQLKETIEKETDFKVKSKDNIYIKCLLLDKLDKIMKLDRFDMTPTNAIKEGTCIAKHDDIKDILDTFKITGKAKTQYTYADIYTLRARAYKKVIGETSNGKGKKSKNDEEEEQGDKIMNDMGRMNIANITTRKQEKITIYKINKEKIKEHFNLYQNRDPPLKNIKCNLITEYGLKPVILEDVNVCLFDALDN